MKWKIREAIFVFLIFGWAMCGPVACAHEPQRSAPLAHDAAGCLTVCPSATYVELSPKGDLCRCWAASAFTYTFLYPDTPKLQEDQRNRWISGKNAVAACLAKGWAWEPSENHQDIVCVRPSAEAPPIDPLKHTSLGRLHLGDWPRYLLRPAWMQWSAPRLAS